MTQPPAPFLVGTWNWNSQSPPPINGQVRSNNGAWANATQLSIDSRATDIGDQSAALKLVVVGDYIRLQHRTDASRWAEFEVTGPLVQNGLYFQFPVSNVGATGVIPNSGTAITVTMTTVPAVDPGYVCYEAYAAHIIAMDPTGSVMDYEHIGEMEWSHWQAAAQAVHNIPANQWPK